MPTIFDAFYVIALAIGSPYFISKLLLHEKFRAGLKQRFGVLGVRHTNAPCIWVHCASVGEVLLIRHFIETLEKETGNCEIVISVNTNTGFSIAKRSFCGKRVFYFPLDFSWVAERVLKVINPSFVILVELELWPNFLIAAKKRHIPIALVNTRISEKSFKWYRVLSSLSKTFYGSLINKKNLFCTRTQNDSERLKKLGIPESRIFLTGNMKYDNVKTEVSEETKKHLRTLFQLDEKEKVIVCGSTFEGEEGILLKTFRQLCNKFDHIRLIIVPRHIDRANDIAKQIRSMGFHCARKSLLDKGENDFGQNNRNKTVILVDTLGDLLNIYSIADCVFVGRSLVAQGGQNMIEPAGLGKPVIVGQYTFNFKEEVQLLKEADAIRIVEDGSSLLSEITHLLNHPDEAGQMGKKAQSIVIKQRGATGQNVKILLENLLKERTVRI